MVKKIFIGIAIFLVILILAGGVAGYTLAYVPAMKIKAKAQVLMAKGQELKDVVKQNNIDALKSKTAEVRVAYNDFAKEAQTIYWASFIPQVADVKAGVEAMDYVLKAGEDGIVAVEPYADLIGFKKGGESFVNKSSQDRLQTAVLTLDKMLAKVDTISDNLDHAEKKIASIDANHWPEEIGGTPVRSQIAGLQEQFVGYTTLFVNAKPFLKKIPTILGKDKEQTYLLLFQNEMERRATGGFLTAFAVLKIKEGKIEIERSSDIYDLDSSISNHPKAPEKILTYHKGVSTFNIRDSNYSPDLVESIKLFQSLYDKSSISVDYDGIFFLDSKILVDMLTIFGDTTAGGVNFSSKPDDRCSGCPQVIYTLFDIVDRPVGYIKTDRKGILGSLMMELFYKAIGFSPSKYWGTLFQTMFKNMDEKHIMLYFKDPETQAAVEKLNYAGRIRDYSGDYLHVNNVNFAGAKSNLFVRETIKSVTKGTNRTVTVDFRNPEKHSDCNLERGGLCLNATLRNWIRVYVPKGSKLVKFDGSLKQVQTYDELGKTVFEGYLEVQPEGKATVNVEYTIPSELTKDYSLLVQKQAGVSEQKWNVVIEGKKKYDNVLEIDKEFR